MDKFGGPQFEGIGNTIRRKRSQISRRPRPKSQPLNESHDFSPLSPAQPSDDVSKVSSEENTGCNANSRRKIFNLNQCASRGFSATRAEGEYPNKRIKEEDAGPDVLHSSGGLGDGTEQGWSGLNHKKFCESVITPSRDGLGNENKLKKVKLKVGGVTRTIQTKSSSQSSYAPRPRQKLILQDNSDEDDFPPSDRNSGLQGIPLKDFASGSFSIGEEDSLMGKRPEKSAFEKQGEKSERVRKSKRVPKKRVLDGALDEDDEDDEDDEIRYLEKLKTSKVAAGLKYIEEESNLKQHSLSRVSKAGKYENLEYFGPLRSGKDGKKSRSERVSEDTDYEEEEEQVSDCEPEGKKKKPMKDSTDLTSESKREMALTTRQRALLSAKDASSASGANSIEFPNGLPPPAPRKQKEKLSEVEQQLKKAEAAERRRMQNEKAARESEAEAIRKILGQDSSRKKREDKMKQRQEDLAQEKAANAHMLASNTVRWVMGPAGTFVTFPDDMGLPHIFDPKPCNYPPPREKCAGPSCANPYKYRDSKSKLPLCSLQCYKAIHDKMQAETAC